MTKMLIDRVVVEQVLEALENAWLDASMGKGDVARHTKAITAFRAALAEQPAEQEPRDARYALAMLVDPEKLEPWQLELYDKAMTTPKPAKLVDHLRLAERFEALHAKGDVWITTIAAAHMARMAATEEPQPAKREPLTREEIFDLAEPFGEFQYGDAQGDKRIDFANAIIAAYEQKNGIGGQV